MKANVTDECIGCGLCPDLCPAVFEMDGDKAKVIADPVPEEAKDLARQAEQSCPVDAIDLEGGG